MVGSPETDEFTIAKLLHMTVAQLRAEMPNREYQQWRAYLVYEAAMMEKARKQREGVQGARKRQARG